MAIVCIINVKSNDYITSEYDTNHAQTPAYPAISSETSSAVSDRGEYANDPERGYVTGYDTEAPAWGQTAQQAWGGVDEPDGQGILTRDYMSGGWVWTGWDYKGEPTPYSWPDINSHFGIYDISGFDKDRAHWYNAWWTDRSLGGTPALYVFPHWNWNEAEVTHETKHLAPCSGMCRLTEQGAFVGVWAFSDAPEVELFLNGESLGRQVMPQYAHVSWQVPYVPGTLEGRAYALVGDDQPVATFQVSTTKPPAALRTAIKDGVGALGISNDGSDMAIVMVEVVDEDGRVVPVHDTVNVTFTVSDANAASVVGTGSGDPADHTPDKSTSRPAFHGKCLAIVSAKSASAGKVVGSVVEVTASADGLSSDSASIHIVGAMFPYPRL